MFRMPGRSHRGKLPPLTEEQQALAKRLSDHVWMLAGDIGARSLTSAPESLETAAKYLEHVLQSYNYTTEREEYSVSALTQRNREITATGVKFPSIDYTVCNVVAELPAERDDSEVVIVGAHYDSVYDCPAANDNGTGVAAMLEIARLLRDEPRKKRLRFVGFTNEEPPFAFSDKMGSYVHAHGCKSRNEKIAAMISLETMGYFSDAKNSQKFPFPLLALFYPTVGNFISLVANRASAPILRQCIGSFRESVKFPSEGIILPEAIRGVSFSDHYFFWKLGYPAIMVTDTAFYRYPHYHEPEDTPDKIDYDKFALVVFGIAQAVKDLCSS